jgi:hypothetical protein
VNGFGSLYLAMWIGCACARIGIAYKYKYGKSNVCINWLIFLLLLFDYTLWCMLLLIS